MARGLNPKENRARSQTGSKGLAGRAWPRHMEPAGAKTPQSVLYEQPPHIRPHHSHPCWGPGRGGLEEGNRSITHFHPHSYTHSPTRLSPHSTLIPSLPEHLLEAPGARNKRRETPEWPHASREDGQAHTTSDGVVCASRQRWQSRTGGAQRTRARKAASTQVMTGPDRGPAHTHLLFSLPLGSGFPVERGLKAVGGELCFLPDSSPPPPYPTSLLPEQSSLERGRKGVPRKGGRCGRLQESIHPLLPLAAPLAAPSSAQLQKHPHLPAAMVLFGGSLAQLACLLADGWQRLVTGTVIPATFLGTQGEEVSTHNPSSPKLFLKPGF